METLLLTVTIVSLALAIVTSVLAWRVMREDRLRSAARIAGLSADIAEAAKGRQYPGAESTVATELPLRDAPVALAGGMFAEREPPASRFRLVAVVAGGALVVAAVIGTLVTLSGPRDAADGPQTAAALQAPAARAVTEVPLELVALGHERQAGRLTVRGVVRNPVVGSEVNQLTAVVLLFNTEGGFIASGTAPVDSAAVAPGAERTFVVSVPAGADVGRYRVSFRSADHVIPHVDRRS